MELLCDNKNPLSNRLFMLGVLLITIGLIVTIVHWPCLSARAILFDDTDYLSNNQLVQNPGWTSVRRFFSEVLKPSTIKGYYQPLAMTSLMLDYMIAGNPHNLRPFHRTSLALHVMNTLLIIVLLYLLLGHIWAAAAAGLLFGVHSMTVESITWVGDRKTVLATFFVLWSFIFYIGYVRRGNLKLYSACVLMYILALLSKPTSIPLPFLLLLLDYWPLGRLKWRSLLEKIPLFLIGTISAVITIISQEVLVSQPSDKLPALHILLTLSHNIVFYINKILWPTNLTPYYPLLEPFSLAHPAILIGVIGTIVLLTILCISLRWTPVFFVCWLFFLLAILPTMQLFFLRNVILADKYAYLPSVGVLLVVAWFLRWLWNRVACSRAGFIRLAIVLCVALLAGLEAAATRRYLVCWQDSERLFRHMVSITPKSAVTRCGLATSLASQERFDEAINEFHKALQLDPNNVLAHNNIGITWSKKGNIAQAIVHYAEALRIDPENAEVHKNIGEALLHQGKLEQAFQHFTIATQINPYYTPAHNNLGVVLLKKNRVDEAIAEFNKVLQLNPKNAKAHNNLGVALIRKNKINEAITHFSKVLILNQNDCEALNDIGNALLKDNKTEKAMDSLDETLQLQSDCANAHRNLAKAYFMQGNIKQAISHWTEELRIQPNHPGTLGNLASAHQRLGQTDEAITYWKATLQLRPNSPKVLNNLAWLLATSQKEECHDPAEAVQLAEKAVKLTNHKNLTMLDTLSVAYAAAGRFTEAVKTAEQTIDLARQAGNDNLTKQIQKHLELFKAGLPLIKAHEPTQKDM